MQLFDTRVKFARPLIEHWLAIRRDLDKVPWEQDMRPTELMAVLPVTQIMEISKPGETFIAMMGRQIKSRYLPDLPRPLDWFKVLPQAAIPKIKDVIRHIIHTPAGVYIRFTLTKEHEREEGEFFALPLMSLKNANHPSVWITLTNVQGIGKLMSPPVSLCHLEIDYIDL